MLENLLALADQMAQDVADIAENTRRAIGDDAPPEELLNQYERLVHLFGSAVTTAVFLNNQLAEEEAVYEEYAPDDTPPLSNLED